MSVLGSLVVLIVTMITTPLKAREARSVMQASATVKAGCTAQTSPLVKKSAASAGKTTTSRARGTAMIKIGCAKSTPFNIRLRGTASKARATFKKVGQNTKKVITKARVRTYRVKGGSAVRLIASASLKRSRYSSRKRSDQLIVAINF